MKVNEHDRKVADYLKSIGVVYEVNLIAEMLHEDWKHDRFYAVFKTQKAVEGFEFSTGIGHRVTSNSKNTYSNSLTSKQVRELKELRELSGPNVQAKHVVNRERKQEWIVCPTAASVLYSLVLDSEASGVSFSDWCESFGYDDDSISSLNTYQACCEIAKRMRKVFSLVHIENLRELLQDY